MSDQIEDMVIPILRNIQADNALIKADIAVLKENTGRMDIRLKSVESHMSGFMSSARYLETEIDSLRGRIEALEEISNSSSNIHMLSVCSLSEDYCSI